ncbi:SH3 domain-containing protein [Clostridium sp. JNZ X4-2]
MKKSLKTRFGALVVGTSLLIPFSVSAASINTNSNISNSSVTTVNTNQELNVKPAYMDKGVVTGNAVNLRSQPNTSSTILRQLNKGDIVWLEGYSGKWCHVVYYSSNGAIQGWIYDQYVSF